MCWVIFNGAGDIICVTTNDTTKEIFLIENPERTAEEVPVV